MLIADLSRVVFVTDRDGVVFVADHSLVVFGPALLRGWSLLEPTLSVSFATVP